MMVKYKVTSTGRAETREIQIQTITPRVWRTASKKSDGRLNQSTCVEFYDGPLNSGHARLNKDSGEWESKSLAYHDGTKRFYLTVCTYVCRELREYYDET